MALAAAVIGVGAPAVARSLALADRVALLLAAYPEALSHSDGKAIHFRDGTRILIDDGKAKTHAEKLAQADIEDMLSQTYPLLACDPGPLARNFDPGRIRSEAFFRALYGRTRQAVARGLVPVRWFGRTLRVQARAGVAAALRAVRDDLARLPQGLHKYFRKSAGTFAWRHIAGTRRLSMHAFAAAIDLDTRHGDYWRWSGGKPGHVPRYRNRIPTAVIAAFERHGFIWGGRWYHYDTMHFEYRPELIAIARAQGCNG